MGERVTESSHGTFTRYSLGLNGKQPSDHGEQAIGFGRGGLAADHFGLACFAWAYPVQAIHIRQTGHKPCDNPLKGFTGLGITLWFKENIRKIEGKNERNAIKASPLSFH